MGEVLIQELELNQYAQSLIERECILARFEQMDGDEKKAYLNNLITLITQSKPVNADIEMAIENSGLKRTYTPCVLLQKDVKYYNLSRIIELPEYESVKVLLLLLSLFKIAYNRRFLVEKNVPHKWWYWDLSDKKTVERIIKDFT